MFRDRRLRSPEVEQGIREFVKSQSRQVGTGHVLGPTFVHFAQAGIERAFAETIRRSP